MDLKKKFWLVSLGALVLLLVLLLALGFFIRSQLPPDVWQTLVHVAAKHAGLLFFSLFFALLVFLLLIGDIFQSYILPLYRLTEETTLISTINPGHRVQVRGCREIVRLGRSINEAAARLQSLQRSLGKQLGQVTAELEKEKQILGAVIGELPAGVVVCNLKGEILLYNQVARKFLPSSRSNTEPTIPSGYLGLGRSIHTLLDSYILDHCLSELSEQMQKREKPTVHNFMAKGAAEQLLKISMVAIRSPENGMTGYVLVISDLTQQMHIEQKTQDLLHWFIEQTQENVAGICTSLNSLIKQRDMSQEEIERNKTMLCENVQVLSGELEEGLAELPVAFKSQWPMQSIDIGKIFQMVKTEALPQTGIQMHLTGSVQKMRLRVELYTFVHGLLILLQLLEYEHAVRDLTCVAASEGELVTIDLLWRGDPVGEHILEAWKQKAFVSGEDGAVLNVQGVLARHEADIETAAGYGGHSYLRLKLPRVHEMRHQQTSSEETRVPWYDFEMLSRSAWDCEETDLPLEKAIYTVFDLETTGLNPLEGDEIVSLSAVRIVNNRMIKEEYFDQLVNPGRPVPLEAVRIHGLSEDMLRDKPGIDEVLPLFARFCEQTVLVAHSADFDLSFLRARETSSGIRLPNQVLDTFKLSVLVHPSQKDHSLEALAERFGVRITNRHTSLGDAQATAEIYLKLIPLLARLGIHTLNQVP